MKNTPSPRGRKPWIAALVAVLIVGLFIGLLMAFLNVYPHGTPTHPGVLPTSTPNQSQSTPQNQVTPGATGTATPVVEQLPAVQTSCPATGTARAAVMTAMPTASPRGILYSSTWGGASSPSQIKRYDVTTGTTTTLFTADPNSEALPMTSVLLSTDKQWLTFMTVQSDINVLHLMRADGKELQTLYCTSDKYTNLTSWSPNQHYLILSVGAKDVAAHLTLIDLTSGSTRDILDAPEAIAEIQVINWVGNTGIYVLYKGTGAGENTCDDHPLYLLSDVTKDSSQQDGNLQAIPLPAGTGLHGSQCLKYTVSPDSSQLLLDSYIGRPAQNYAGEVVPLPTGPSTLSLRPIAGGNAQIINDAPTHNIINAGFITNSKVWFIIRNPATNNDKNGLWMMNTDGSGLVLLQAEPSTTNDTSNDVMFNGLSFTQDTQDFAFQDSNNQQGTLIFGSTNGGSTTTFATATGQEGLTIIGWT